MSNYSTKFGIHILGPSAGWIAIYKPGQFETASLQVASIMVEMRFFNNSYKWSAYNMLICL